jgi:trehalose 6-phosphate synthase
MSAAEHPVVLVQDYHFALLPKLLKERRPDARVAIFWHIPWPNPEAFGICPWQGQLLDGLLGADLIGFHTQFHCNNFLETVERSLEARVEWERFAVSRNGHTTTVLPFPISGPRARRNKNKRTARATRRRFANLRRQLGVEGRFLAWVSINWTTQGPHRTVPGIERFLENSAFLEQFTFVQIAAPAGPTHAMRSPAWKRSRANQPQPAAP